MALSRRTAIQAFGLGLGLALGGLAAVPRAAALEADAARQHVQAAIDEVLTLVSKPGEAPGKAGALSAILTRYAAMPQIARFAAGRAWREMSPDQQTRFEGAFLHFLSTIYARRFQDYGGETVTVGSVSDAGKRGLSVASSVSQAQGSPIAVDWLVTDRPGRVVIADIVIEGVSLLVTQREEVAAMLEARGNDIERLITDMGNA